MNNMLSIIVPVFNEADNILEFNTQLLDSLSLINKEYEVIYVDDGSTDNTYKELVFLSGKKDLMTILRLNKNYGQTLALRAGLDNSHGDIVIFIDADLQNDPKDIPLLLKKMEEGYDIVSGWRHRRKDSVIFRVIPSIAANMLISIMLGRRIHDIGCSLKAYRREVLLDIDLYGEMHRIIPVYAIGSNAKIAELKVNHRPRQKGKSKYGISRAFKLLPDMFSAYFVNVYSTKPMYFFGSIGFFLLASGILLFCAISLRVILFGGVWISPLLFIAIMVLLMGFQVLLMGILAEILMKLYYKKEQKYPYRISAVVQNGKELEVES